MLITPDTRQQLGNRSTPAALDATVFPRALEPANLSSSSSATSRPTLRITRRPTPLVNDDNFCVGGRVHALVMRRPTPAGTRTRREHVSAIRPACPTHALRETAA